MSGRTIRAGAVNRGGGSGGGGSSDSAGLFDVSGWDTKTRVGVMVGAVAAVGSTAYYLYQRYQKGAIIDKVNELYSKAVKSIKDKKWGEAIGSLTAAIETDPTNIRIMLKRAEVYQQIDEYV